MGIYLRRKSWYFDFIHQGVRYAGAIGPVSKTVAKEEFARKKAAVVEGKLNPLRARRSPLFKDFAEELLNHKRTVLRPSSADRIFFALNRSGNGSAPNASRTSPLLKLRDTGGTEKRAEEPTLP